VADLHIDDFYRDVARIFLRLHSSFPRKIILYVDEISGDDEPDEFGLHSPRFQAGFSAMVWLAQEGYLRFDETIREEALDQAVLTRKGFLLLSSRSELQLMVPDSERIESPSVLEHTRTNIAQLRLALKDGSSILIKKCVDYLLNQPAPR
jgi:hypothetical protein